MRIYIASPYSKGNTLDNVSKSVNVYNELIRLGYTPFCPLLSHFAALVAPDITYHQWLQQDLEWVAQCEAVLRLEGESEGADQEVNFARQKGIPIYFSFKDLTGQEIVLDSPIKTALDKPERRKHENTSAGSI